MKALSIRPDYALDILYGKKINEYRSWDTKHRGDLLICCTARKIPGTISRHAICVVTLEDTFKLSDGTYLWRLSDVQVIKPFVVKGQQRLFDVPDERIEYPAPEDVETINGEEIVTEDFMNKYYEPLAN